MKFANSTLLAVVALAMVASSVDARDAGWANSWGGWGKGKSGGGKYTSPVDYLTKSSGFSTLVTAATEAGLVPTLSDSKLVATLFLPNNKAFDALVAETGLVLADVLKNKELLTSVLTHHVHAGDAYCSFKNGATTLTTLNTQDIVVTKKGNKLTVTDASGRVIDADAKAIKAGKSTIFLLKNVLLPKTA